VVFDSIHLDLQPYAGFDMNRYVRRTYCSWEELGWRSLLVQRFDHVPLAEDMELPAAADLHLILPVGGRTVMETRIGSRWSRHTWVPGRLELGAPDRPALRRYRAAGPLRSVQVHLPRGTVERTAEQLGGRAVDYASMAPAENYIHADQAACEYSWRTPPSRSRRRTFKLTILTGSMIECGTGRNGAA
jgi:AraC family transcriptional regulator